MHEEFINNRVHVDVGSLFHQQLSNSSVPHPGYSSLACGLFDTFALWRSVLELYVIMQSCLPCLDSGLGANQPKLNQHQQHHGFDLPDPFRKFPSSVNVAAAAANVEFNDELSMATLLGGPGDRSSPNGHHHHHHGHHHTHQQQQHQHQHQRQYEDPTAYEDPTTAYRTHNIFDVSASSASSTASSAFLTQFSSSSTTTTNSGGGGAGSQPSSLLTLINNTNSTLPSRR